MMKDVVELEKASVLKEGQDILVTEYKSYTEIFEEDAKEIDGAYLSMSQGGDMFVIIDLSKGNTKVKKNAETYLTKKGKMVPFTKAMAIVRDTKSLRFSRMIGKRFVFPYREFKTRDEALEWINMLRN